MTLDNRVGEIDRPPGLLVERRSIRRRWTNLAKGRGAWLLVLLSSAAVIAWVGIVFTISSARFVVFAPRAKTGFEVLVALLALFAALILCRPRSPCSKPNSGSRSVSSGVGGLVVDYILPLLNGEENFNAALYETLTIRTLAILSFAIGLAAAHPPRVPARSSCSRHDRTRPNLLELGPRCPHLPT